MKNKIIMCTVAAIIAGSAYGQEESSWTDNIEISGDMRFRHEYIDQEGKEERHRWRLRLRPAIKAKVNDEVKVGARLSSGGDNPTSANSTFDGGATTKDIRLDRAFLTYAPASLDGVSITAGKMKNPFRLVNDLIFDSDLAPEGVTVSLDHDEFPVLLNAGSFWVEENSSGDDIMMYGAQAALNLEGEEMDFMVGASYFIFDGIKGSEPLYDDDAFGNSVDEIVEVDDDGEESSYFVHAEDITNVEGFAKMSMDVGMPLTIYADYVVNTEADDNDLGYQVGFNLGKAKKAGSYEFGYYWRYLEADAVLGLWTDSNAGGGGTDSEGHEITAAYAINDGLKMAVCLLLSDIGLEGESSDYTRVQFDISTKF